MVGLRGYEACFKLAKKGDMSKYQLLYHAFMKEGFIIADYLKRRYRMPYVDEGEIESILIELFLKFMKCYKPKRSSIQTYAENIIRRGLTCYIVRSIAKADEVPLSLDYSNNEGISLIDTIESDDYRKMIDSIDYNSMIHTISSLSKSKVRVEKLKSRIILLRVNGYKLKQICEILKITRGQLKYLEDKIKVDENYTDIKIDLK